MEDFIPSYFDENYLVNKLGQIYSVKRKRILTPYNDNNKGYLHIDLGRVTYKAHRVILQTFKPIVDFKKRQVNHINNDKKDNRLENLEWSDQRDNMNKRMRSKKYGIYFRKSRNRYIARIKINNKNINIGDFKNKEEAYAAFKKAYFNHYNVNPWEE